MNERVENRQKMPARQDLVSLAAPVFDLVLRLKAGIVQPSNALRPQIGQMLNKFEERAGRFNFNPKLIPQAKFALAAFVDETVLTANFPLKEEWEKYPLQLEYFGEQLAGVKFYERLDALLPHIEKTADAVEVFYMCLLLGFKGKFAVYGEQELLQTIRRTAQELTCVGRLENAALSPNWLREDQPQPPPKKGLPKLVKIAAFGGLGAGILAYLGMFLLSSKFLNDAMSKLLF